MRAALAVALLLTAVPAGAALAQTQPPAPPPLLLANPADANKDGVVTDDERADYLARKAAGAMDQPGLPVSAPKAGGASTIIMGKSGGGEPSTGAAGEPPAAASEFEKTVEAGIRKDTKRDE
jgi:hypothetical protein